MILHIKAVGATDIPKMDVIGKADPYLSIKYNKSDKPLKTSYCKKTYSPIWDEEFHLPVDNNDFIHMELIDYDKLTDDDLISTRDFPIQSFQLGKIYDDWFDFFPAPKIPKPGKVHLVFHLANNDDKPFVPSVKKEKAKNVFHKLKHQSITQQQYEEFRESFNEIDEDNNGSITLEETKKFLEKIGVNHVFAPLAFEVCNKDPNGSIKFDEFAPFYQILDDIGKDQNYIYRLLFTKLDEDKSGYLELKEVLQLLFFFGGDDWNEDDAQRFIENHDSNNDGKLNFDELCSLINDELDDN